MASLSSIVSPLKTRIDLRLVLHGSRQTNDYSVAPVLAPAPGSRADDPVSVRAELPAHHVAGERGLRVMERRAEQIERIYDAAIQEVLDELKAACGNQPRAARQARQPIQANARMHST